MKARTIIYFVIPTAVIFGVICYKGFVTKNLDGFDLVRATLVLSGLTLALASGRRKRRDSKKLYQNLYGHIIGNAFAGEPRQEKLFYKALDDFNRDRNTACLKKLERLLAKCRRSADRFAVLSFLGLCCKDMGRYGDAIKHYTAALQIQEHSTVASNLGNCYVKLDRTDTALEYFHRAVRANDRNPYAYNNLAQLHCQLGNYGNAIEYAEKVLALTPKLPQVLSILAIAWAMLGNEEQSEIYLQRAAASGYDGEALRAYIKKLKE